MSQFTKDQLVWAKVKGFPWWPAIVAKIYSAKDSAGNKNIVVNFVGDPTHAMLSENNLMDFKAGLSQFSNPKMKKLVNAINIANRIHTGMSRAEAEDLEEQNQKNGDQIKGSILGNSKSKPATSEGSIQSIQSVKNGMKVHPDKKEKTPSHLKKTNSQAKSIALIVIQNKNKRSEFGQKSSDSLANNLKNEKTLQVKVKESVAKKNEAEKLPKLSPREIETIKELIQKPDAKKDLRKDSKITDNIEQDKAVKKQQISKTEAVNLLTPGSQNYEITASRANSQRNSDVNIIKGIESEARNFVSSFEKIAKNKHNLQGAGKELAALVHLVASFQKFSYSDEQIASSSMGKLFQRIYSLLHQYKEKLDPKGLELLASTVRIVHQMKQQTVEFYLNPTEILNSLEFSGNIQRASRSVSKSEKTIELAGKATPKQTSQAGDSKPTQTDRANLIVINSSQKSAAKSQANPAGQDSVVQKDAESTLASSSDNTKLEVSSGDDSHIDPSNLQGAVNPDTSLAKVEDTPSKKTDEVDLSTRKKYCTKLASILASVYQIDKTKVQELTSKVEKKIMSSFHGSIAQYKEMFRSLSLLIKIKSKDISCEDLYNVDKMSNQSFFQRVEDMLKHKNDEKHISKNSDTKNLVYESKGDYNNSSNMEIENEGKSEAAKKFELGVSREISHTQA